MKWDTDHNLDWNWWYIRLYFQEHRRHLVDRFHATLNLRGSGDTLEETKTDAFNAPETADKKKYNNWLQFRRYVRQCYTANHQIRKPTPTDPNSPPQTPFTIMQEDRGTARM